VIASLLACTSGSLPVPGAGATTASLPAPQIETVPGSPPPLVRVETAPPAPGGTDLAAALFPDDRLLTFDVELSDEAMEALRVDPYAWVEGAFVWEGVRYDPVGVRIKGQNSFLPVDVKPSLKIQLDRFVPGWSLFGLKELTLDNGSNDPSLMHERVGYRLFREHGIPASRAAHAWVRINGEDRGLYTHVETVDDEFLALWYADPDGALWELWDVDFQDAYVDLFQHESGPDDRTQIQAIADALELGGQAAYDAADPYVDWDQFVTFAAACAVSGQFDSYPWRSPGDDVHFYFDPADGQLDMLPHGMDETFQDPWYDVTWGGGLLLATCVAVPECADRYRDAVFAVQETAEAIDLLGYAETVREEVEPLALADPMQPWDDATVLDYEDLVIEFVSTRRERLTEMFGAP
jgi:hypothetical protein